MSAAARGAHAAQAAPAEPIAPARPRRALPAWSLTAAFGLAYVIVAPLSTDLAAAGYRSDLFSRVGLTLWDNGWYGGHHLLAYSLLSPPLSALFGAQLLAALAMTLATWLFGMLVAGRFTARAERVATLWFALGAAVGLLGNRIAFELGLTLGLAALVAATRPVGRGARAGAAAGQGGATGRRGGATSRGSGHRGAALTSASASALILALLCTLASPLAGAFVALAALAWALAERRRAIQAAFPCALAAAALVPVALLAIAFPEGGAEPFAASAFYPTLALTVLLGWAIPRERRVLRLGVALYGVALLGSYVLATPVGGNADRLGALVAGPLLACVLSDRAPSDRALGDRRTGRHGRVWALIALALLLLYWQLRAPIADYVSAASDPAAQASYFTPLLGELRRLDVGYGRGPTRIEVVPTRNRAEARWVADRVPLARGWERQLDTHDDAVFYARGGQLSAAGYRAWLAQNAIAYVALPDAPLDYSARTEARLVRAAPGYLREVWRSPHWRLFAVRSAAPMSAPPSTLTQLGSDSFTLRAPRPGSYLVRVRFTPYWALQGGRGCLSRAPGDWTELQASAAGRLRVGIDFALSRVFEHGQRCR